MIGAPELRSPLRVSPRLLAGLTAQDSHLQRMPDLDRLCKKFHRGTASLQDCVRVYQAVQRLCVPAACVVACLYDVPAACVVACLHDGTSLTAGR